MFKLFNYKYFIQKTLLALRHPSLNKAGRKNRVGFANNFLYIKEWLSATLA